MSGHTTILKISVIIDIVNNKALFFGMTVSSDFS